MKKTVFFVVGVFVVFFLGCNIPYANGYNTKKTDIQIVKNAKFQKKGNYTLPTIILGIFTFFITFAVLYTRYRISKEIKKRNLYNKESCSGKRKKIRRG